LELDFVQPGDRVVVKHGWLQDLFDSSLGIPNKHPDHVLDQGLEFCLVETRGEFKTTIFPQEMKQSGTVRDPKAYQCHIFWAVPHYTVDCRE